MNHKIKWLAVLICMPLFLCACSASQLSIFPPKQPTVEQLKQLAEAKALEEKYQKDYADAFAKCEKMPWIQKKAYEKQVCLNEAEKINPAQKYDHIMSKAVQTAYLKIALDYSEGKISQQRFLLMKEEVEVRAQELVAQKMQVQIQMQQQQEEIARLEKAAAWQRFGQAMQNYSNQMQQQQFQQQMLMQQNRMRTTNCHAFGSNLNCTTY